MPVRGEPASFSLGNNCPQLPLGHMGVHTSGADHTQEDGDWEEARISLRGRLKNTCRGNPRDSVTHVSSRPHGLLTPWEGGLEQVAKAWCPEKECLTVLCVLITTLLWLLQTSVIEDTSSDKALKKTLQGKGKEELRKVYKSEGILSREKSEC